MDMQQPEIFEEPYRAEEDAAPVVCGPRAAARLIEYASGSYVALPPHTTLEIIEHPAIVNVPGAAYYAFGMLAWQGHYLPVIDVHTLLQSYRDTPISAPRYALVLAYQRAPGSPIEYGALGLDTLPQTIEVGDEAWRELPTCSDIWPLLSLSCFQHKKAIVPILDTAKLLSGYHG